MGSRPHSTRRHAWHVQPLSASTATPVYSCTGSRRTVLCGHLFNAEAERNALGLGVGSGEECCITLEPIADARLAFSDNIRVSCLYPNLTGVQLLCGHRFSAANLLWHWCMSPMVCPMCRAPYVLNGLLGNGAVTTSSAIDNFPIRYLRLLRGIIEEHVRERALVQEQEDQAAAVNVVLTNVFESVLTPVSDLYLMLSFVGIGAEVTHHSVRLQPSTTTEPVLGNDPLRFCVDRAATRYISRLLNTANNASRRTEQQCRMTATILCSVGTTSHSLAVVLPVATFDSPVLPMVPGGNGVVILSETGDTIEHDTMDALTIIPGSNPLSGNEQASGVIDNTDFQPPSVENTTSSSSSSLSDQPVPYMASIEAVNEIRFGFFRDDMSENTTLVSITISLEEFSIAAVGSDNMPLIQSNLH